MTVFYSDPILGVAAPFVKWVGGKRNTVQELIARLPAEVGAYYEPFAGGAALYFAIHGQLTRAFLSDSNWELVMAFKAVQKDPEALIEKLEEHARKDSDDYYLKVRARHELQDPIEVAARLIYLNKTCYKGLYRVNKRGEFNVPRGPYDNRDIVQRENILACSKALQKSMIEYREFDIIRPKAGDFVFPPYHPVSDTASFTKYTKGDFSEKDQERLRDFALKLHKEGVKVMLSNSDTAFIRHLYRPPTWQLAVVRAPRMVNSKAERRGAVNELVITNYAPPSVMAFIEAAPPRML